MFYCVVQAGLELGILHLQSAEIIGVCYHTQLWDGSLAKKKGTGVGELSVI